MKRNSGITLIALVITIIVILILAGVSISLTLGNNGVLNQATKAIVENTKAQEKEKLQMEIASSYDTELQLLEQNLKNNINSHIDEVDSVTGSKFPLIVRYNSGNIYKIKADGTVIEPLPGEIGAGEKAPSDKNAIYVDGENIAVIPAGYTVSNVEGEQSIEGGLVIKDDNGNEFVWIPVNSSDFQKMFVEDSTGWNLRWTSINVKYKTNSTTLGQKSINRGNPGSDGTNENRNRREADMLGSSSYDRENSCYTEAGFNSFNDFAYDVASSYTDMAKSVKENKGFYIGRFELSGTIQSPTVKKSQNVLESQTWYSFYKACRSFTSQNGIVQSRMVWGCQWDQICRFMNEHGDKVSLDSSSSYGNYRYQSQLCTGMDETYKVNNIYDFAGNFGEFTQEASYNCWRIARGGKKNGGEEKVSTGSDLTPNSTYHDYVTSRVAIYVK